MRLFNLSAAFFLLMIFIAEYPKWAEVGATFLVVLFAVFIVDWIGETLERFGRVLVVDLKGIRIRKLSRPAGSSRSQGG